MAYMDKVERSKCGPDGRVTKLDALDAALRFFRLELLKDNPNNALHTKSLRISETIKSWKATLRKQKTRKRIQRMEELSAESESLSLDDVEAIIHCDAMWDEFTTIAENLGKGLPISDHELNRCTVMVATLLTFRSWQRPGAAYHMTLDEWEHRKELKEGDQTSVVISVLKHKTGLSGSARVVLRPGDYSKVLTYATTMRIYLDPENKSQYFLSLTDGRKLQNFNTRFKTLSKRYGFEPMTATKVRKIAATEATLKLSGPQAALVTKQLAHTPDTDAKFYQAISGPQHAALAVKYLSEGRKSGKAEPQPKPEAASNPMPNPNPNPETPPAKPLTHAPQPDSEAVSTLTQPGPASPIKITRKKRRFTKEETETIKLYFMDYIKEHNTPNSEECKVFVENHPMARTSQQIQDKVKDLIKRAKLQ